MEAEAESFSSTKEITELMKEVEKLRSGETKKVRQHKKEMMELENAEAARKRKHELKKQKEMMRRAQLTKEGTLNAINSKQADWEARRAAEKLEKEERLSATNKWMDAVHRRRAGSSGSASSGSTHSGGGALGNSALCSESWFWHNVGTGGTVSNRQHQASNLQAFKVTGQLPLQLFLFAFIFCASKINSARFSSKGPVAGSDQVVDKAVSLIIGKLGARLTGCPPYSGHMYGGPFRNPFPYPPQYSGLMLFGSAAFNQKVHNLLQIATAMPQQQQQMAAMLQ